MVIECNEINQVYNELMIALQDCNKVKNSDLRKMLDLIYAVYTCANGGADYSTIENDLYESETDTVISYPPNSFHSISVVISLGTIVYNDITLGAGNTINIEFSTLNQQEFTFLAKAGSKVLVEYIIETV